MAQSIQRNKNSFNIGTCSWSEWWETDCSVTCGQGTVTRTRYNRIPQAIEGEGSCTNLTEKHEEICDTKIPCMNLGKRSIVG